MTSAAQIVTVGAASLTAPTDPESVALAAALGRIGLPLVGRVIVEDDEALLERALTADLALTVIVVASASGADAARRALARVVGARLVLNERMLAALEERYRRRERPLPRQAERLALLPQGAAVWATPDGEPAWVLERGGAAFVVVSRGAGFAATLDQHLLPLAAARAGGRVVLVRNLRTTGVTPAQIEERLADRLGAPDGAGGAGQIAIVAADGEVWVRLSVHGASRDEAAEALAAAEAPIVAVLGADCYGRDAESLEQVVGRLLAERRLTVAVAESCTGGLLGHRLTNVPGSSAYFERGVVAYSNRAKEALLGVPAEVLRTHGAVSAPCAEAMARGIVESTGSACGLAITGIAGPDGGTPAKPVGTVFIGLAVRGAVESRRFLFEGDRTAVKWMSTQRALDLLRRSLEATRAGGKS